MTFHCSHLSGTRHRAVGTALKQRADRLWKLPSEQATSQHTHSPSSREKRGQETKVIYQYHDGHMEGAIPGWTRPQGPRLLPVLIATKVAGSPWASHSSVCDPGDWRFHCHQPWTRTSSTWCPSQGSHSTWQGWAHMATTGAQQRRPVSWRQGNGSDGRETRPLQEKQNLLLLLPLSMWQPHL